MAVSAVLEDGLTICSVAHESRRHLELNWELASRLNPGARWRWIVIENTPRGSIERLDGQDERYTLLEGVAADEGIPSWGRGSYQHAAALNKVVARVPTRFVLFLDPDFYILRPNWIEVISTHMLDEDLGFFGVPWHPRWFIKYRYFPCVHCLFIDLARVERESLDFTPEHDWSPADESGPVAYWLAVKDRLPPVLRRSVRVLGRTVWALALKDRRVIGSSRDTGYRLFRAYGRIPRVRYEYAIPMFRPRQHFGGPRYALTWANRLAEKFLPDRRCYIPKHVGSYTEVGFREFGYPDVSSLGWEEFVWHGEPFGFHVRRNAQRAHDVGQVAEVLQRIAGLRGAGVGSSPGGGSVSALRL